MTWKIEESVNWKGGYIGIRGEKGEKIADIFPFAGVGGVGLERARENAAKIVNADQLWEALQNLLDYCQEGCPDGSYSAVIDAKAALAQVRLVDTSHKD